MAILLGILPMALSGVPDAAHAEGQPLLCLPPSAPAVDLPARLLATYRTEISAEFEVYFSALSEYIACLDEERLRAMAEARDVAGAYSDFLDTSHLTEDIQ